jgi:hypothetical protein
MISCRRLASVTTLSVVIALVVSESACAAGNATQTFVGPGPWIDVADPAYGAVGNGVHQDGPAIQAALTAAAAPVCATVALTCTPQNTFLVSQTLTVPSCVKFRGQCGGGPGIVPAPANTFGSTLKWGGPATTLPQTTPFVLYHGVSQSSLEDMNIDCQGVSGIVGTQYDSESSLNPPKKPPSDFNRFHDVVWRACHIAFVVGAPGNTVTPPKSCESNPAQAGCFEADQFRLDHFIVYGTPPSPTNPQGDPTSEGIHINSSNGAQDSVIALGNVQLVHIGVHILSTNGVLTISEFTGGSVVGDLSTAALFQFDSAVVTSPNLINNESEGSWAFAVLDSSCNPVGTPGTPAWVANQWNNTVLIAGCENVASIGNGTGVGQKTAAGTSHVVSINDGWTSAGAGKVTAIGAGIDTQQSIIAQNEILAAAPVPPPNPPCSFPTNAHPGDITSCETRTGGSFFLGGDGNASISRDTSGNIVLEDTTGNVTLENTTGKGTRLAGQVTAERTLTLPDGNSSTSLVASLTTSAAGSDVVAIQGVNEGSHCVLTPTNAAAAANIAAAFVSRKGVPANTITVAHAAIANMTYDIQCTAG